MTVKSLASETTHYLTVQNDDGTSKEYTRTCCGEWCEQVMLNASYMDDLVRVPHSLATTLEQLFQEATKNP